MSMRTILATVLIVMFTGSVWADTGYSMQQGAQWQGVKIGDGAVRSRDVICRYQSCFTTSQRVNIPDLLSKYGIQSLKFDDVAKVSGVVRSGRLLTNIPSDLGWMIYSKARELHYKTYQD